MIDLGVLGQFEEEELSPAEEEAQAAERAAAERTAAERGRGAAPPPGPAPMPMQPAAPVPMAVAPRPAGGTWMLYGGLAAILIVGVVVGKKKGWF